VNFHQADLTKGLEFEAGTFDIVHARFVMMHLVNGQDALRRASRLVKPGGLLLIEDADIVSFAESGGPATRRFIYKFKEIQDRLGVDVEFGKKVESIITSLGDFPEIQVKKLSMPFGGNGPDEAMNQLGLEIKKSFATASETLAKRLSDQGLTHDIVREYNEEQERSENKSAMDLYLCWARRWPT